MMNSKRVFVSGGAGVIGLEIIPLLIERGASVLVGDLKQRPTSFPLEVRYRQGDLNYLTQKELESFAPDIFIHLAATFERSTETYDFLEENFWHNLHLSHHLMTLVKDLPSLKRVVFASSYLIYDPNQYQFSTPQDKPVSLKETDAVLPRNLTGMAKFASEIELRFLDSFRSKHFTTVCARIFRGYGRNSQDIISRWIRQLLVGESIAVYRPEGFFDYIYAQDSAEGLIRLASNNIVTGIINLGTGRARRVQDVIDVLKMHFSDLRTIENTVNIPFEASQADMTLYRAAIGWMPEFDLERSIPLIIKHEESKLSDQKKKNKNFGNILITSTSKKAPLVRAVQAAARKLHPHIQVIAGDLSETALTRYIADSFWKMPRSVDIEIDAIIAGCKERDIRTIIPTRDGELLFWANFQPLLAEQGINVIVSPISSVQTCLDKLAFAEFGVSNNLPFIPASTDINQTTWEFYVVKERYGAGSRKIGLNLGREFAARHGATLEYPIYQPYIAGQEISIDAWLDRNYQVKGLVLRSRDQVIDGESQVTTTFRDAQIEVIVKGVLQTLKLRGPVVLQAIIDADNNLHIIECNSRFGGASTLAIAAGLDMFYWSLLESYGVDVSEYPFDRVSGEIRQIRVPSDIYLHDHHF
jgi:carbamoyl-phosphate synthase large subunit